MFRNLFRLFLAGLFFAGLLQMGAWLFLSSVPEKDAREIEDALTREVVWSEVDPANPDVVNQKVDYSEGEAASWYPRNESPLLQDMVDAGQLPPVEERVGPEPVVMKGAEGIGKYGGAWLRIANTEGDGLGVIASRLSYASVARFSPQGLPIVPHVVKDFEVSEDNRTFTFYFRKGMRWSDGALFTTEDLLYFWEEEVLDPMIYGTPPSWFMSRGEPPVVQALDKYTLRITFPHPYGLFLYNLATSKGAAIVNSPKHYLAPYHPRHGDKALIEEAMKQRNSPSPQALYRSLKAMGNPEHPRLWPWIVRVHKSNGPYSFVRNPYYCAVDTEGNQLPYIDQIFYEVKNPEMVTISAAAGGASMQARHIRFEQYTFLMSQRERGNYNVYHWYPGDRSQYVINMNLNRKAPEGDEAGKKKGELLKDIRFRKALSLAVDRQRIIDAEYGGMTEPAQIAPGPASFFYNEKAFRAFTEFNPEEANRLLDSIGLSDWDFEGYRLFPDGTPMTFYLSYTSFTGSGPAQFLIEDWARVGVRVIPRERSRMLFEVETQSLQHDFCVWIGNGEFFPVIEPRSFVPINPASYYAPAYGKWYMLGGLYGHERVKKAPGAVSPPKEGPLWQALRLYDQCLKYSDLDKIREIFDKVLDIAARNVWTINISTPPPVLAVVADNMKNVPKDVVYSWDFQSPGNAGPETFYMTENTNTPGTVEQMKNTILNPVTAYEDETVSAKGNSSGLSGRRFEKLLGWLFKLVGLCLLILVAWKHPFIARRLLIMIPTLLIISVIVFTVIQLPPGNYVQSEILRLKENGDEASMQRIGELKELFHLDEPMVTRYLRWMGLYWFISFDRVDTGLLQGNLGRSMENMQPVGEIVGDRILLTFLISLGTILFTWALAIPIGIYSAVRQYSLGDYIFSFLGFIGMCIPGFLLALLLMFAASEWLGITVTGLFSPEYATQPEWNWAKFMDLMKHIWIPVVVMGVNGTAAMIRVMRANLLDELRKPYVMTAKAKGLRPLHVLMKYPVRLALNPFISSIGGLFPMLVSGGAIVAMVLSLPTVGPLMLSALFSEDMYLAGSMLMVLSLLGVLGTLVSDILLLWLDPRIRMGSKRTA